jgi:hypothetical protein
VVLWRRRRFLLRRRPQQPHRSRSPAPSRTRSVVTGFRQADGDTFISQVVQVVYAGDLAGSVVEHIDVVIHPDGTLNARGADVCTCTLTGTGLSGTIVLPFTATGDASGSGRGRFTIGDRTGGWAGEPARGWNV